MNEQNLDQLLALRQERPLPTLPASFQQDVWREIRYRKSELIGLRSSWVSWFLEPLLQPTMTLATLTFAVLLGIGMGTSALAESRNIQARSALNLQVFSSASPALPATLLGYTE